MFRHVAFFTKNLKYLSFLSEKLGKRSSPFLSFFLNPVFQTISILEERWMMVSLYILTVVLFITNIMFSLFLFRRRSIETKRRELKSMLDDFRRERDEVISIISSSDKERWLRFYSSLFFSLLSISSCL